MPGIVEQLKRFDADFLTLTEATGKNLDELRGRLAEAGYRYSETACVGGPENSLLVVSKLPLTRQPQEIASDGMRWLEVTIEALDLKVLSVHIPGSDDRKFAADGHGVSGKAAALSWPIL